MRPDLTDHPAHTHPILGVPRQPLTTAPFIDVGGHSDTGRAREVNTDSFLTADLSRALVLGPSSLPIAEDVPLQGGTQGKLLIVADGTGDGHGGSACSAAVVDTIARFVATSMAWATRLDQAREDELIEAIQREVRDCQSRVRAEMPAGEQATPIGTTLTMALMLWPVMYVVHVGDSRAYLYRDRELRELTADHTIAQRMVDHAVLAADRADDAPFGHVLTNTIGGGDDSIAVEHQRVELQLGDVVLLCTDGLTRHLSDLEIRRELERGATAAMSCRELVEAVNRRGGQDNTTVIVAGIHG